VLQAGQTKSGNNPTEEADLAVKSGKTCIEPMPVAGLVDTAKDRKERHQLGTNCRRLTWLPSMLHCLSPHFRSALPCGPAAGSTAHSAVESTSRTPALTPSPMIIQYSGSVKPASRPPDCEFRSHVKHLLFRRRVAAKTRFVRRGHEEATMITAGDGEYKPPTNSTIIPSNRTGHSPTWCRTVLSRK
jgi:hypothetical protein